MKRMLPLVLVAACNFNSSSGAGTDAGGDDQSSDGGADATPDGPGTPDSPADTGPDMCFGTGATIACLAALPTNDVEWTLDTILDTGLGAPCAVTTNAEAASWCVIAGNKIKIDAGVTLRVVGDKPVVFAAIGAIEIAGDLDISSGGTSVGAGGDPASCAAGIAATAYNSAGGGYGGSFGGRGGSGGSNDGGVGGTAPASVTATTLRGGCPGGASGMINNVAGGAGHGGGAVALLSRTQLQLTGTVINASGAGGRVADLAKLGGGGGGSGGMIVLDAPVILAGNASIFADGGSGAEGNAGALGQAGQAPATVGVAAIGGAGLSAGGDGGDGSSGADGHAAIANANVNGGGGGGGGGGTGVILVSQPLTNALVSPPPDSI